MFKKPDHKEMYYIGSFVLVAVAIILLVVHFYHASPGYILKTEKAAILKQVTSASTTPLSEAEKQAIFANLKGNKIQGFQFSATETAQLLKALNH